MPTLRILIAGLIAVVPQSNQEGLNLLFLSGSADHVPYVYSLRGECDPQTAECFHGFAQLAKDALALDVGASSPSRYPLFWIPRGEAMEVLGPGLTGVTLELQGASAPAFGFPEIQSQVGDYRWLPTFSRVPPSKARVRQNCLGKAKNCPISARMHLPGGRLSSCLLENDLYLSGGRPLTGYRATSVELADSRPNQAVPIIAMMELPLRGSEIELVARPLDGVGTARAKIRAVDEEIVLLVANERSSTSRPYTYHSRHFNDILASSLDDDEIPHLEATGKDGPALIPADPGCRDVVGDAVTFLTLGFLDWQLNRPECGIRAFAAQ